MLDGFRGRGGVCVRCLLFKCGMMHRPTTYELLLAFFSFDAICYHSLLLMHWCKVISFLKSVYISSFPCVFGAFDFAFAWVPLCLLAWLFVGIVGSWFMCVVLLPFGFSL